MRSNPHARDLAQTEVEGLRLEQYAGVCAAIALEFPLSDALANDRIARDKWLRAGPAWSAKLAGLCPRTAIRQAYTAKLAEAEAWLGRRIRPLDDDLESWLSFLGAWSADPAPLALLSRLGMVPSDLSRLQQGWTQRMAGDPALCRRALEIAVRRPSRLPHLQITPAKLRPFPWSDHAPAEATPSKPVCAAPPAPSSMNIAIAIPSFMLPNSAVAISGG